MTDLDEIFKALSKSAFRNKFHLQSKDIIYLRSKGLPTVIVHAREFIAKRLAPQQRFKMMENKPLSGVILYLLLNMQQHVAVAVVWKNGIKYRGDTH
jgi:hypothetical protein